MDKVQKPIISECRALHVYSLYFSHLNVYVLFTCVELIVLTSNSATMRIENVHFDLSATTHEPV
jgi:hypothetical protein